MLAALGTKNIMSVMEGMKRQGKQTTVIWYVIYNGKVNFLMDSNLFNCAS